MKAFYRVLKELNILTDFKKCKYNLDFVNNNFKYLIDNLYNGNLEEIPYYSICITINDLFYTSSVDRYFVVRFYLSDGLPQLVYKINVFNENSKEIILNILRLFEIRKNFPFVLYKNKRLRKYIIDYMDIIYHYYNISL